MSQEILLLEIKRILGGIMVALGAIIPLIMLPGDVHVAPGRTFFTLSLLACPLLVYKGSRLWFEARAEIAHIKEIEEEAGSPIENKDGHQKI